MKEKPIARKLEYIFTPIVTVYVEEFEDGTFDVKTYSDIDWSDSFSHVYDRWVQEDLEAEKQNHGQQWNAVNRFIDTLALRQYYPAWAPEDEPF